jgi:hypothetical protein
MNTQEFRETINAYNRANYKARSLRGCNNQLIKPEFKKKVGRKPQIDISTFDSNFIEFIKIESILFNKTNDKPDDIATGNEINLIVS